MTILSYHLARGGLPLSLSFNQIIRKNYKGQVVCEVAPAPAASAAAAAAPPKFSIKPICLLT